MFAHKSLSTGTTIAEPSLEKEAKEHETIGRGRGGRWNDVFRGKRSRRWRTHVIAYLFLLPALCAFVVFLAYPMVSGLLLSFQSMNLVDPPQWVGLGNFQYVVTDPLFLTAWKNTAQFTLYGLLFGYLVPMVLAVAVNEMRRGGGFFRFAFFLPGILPPLVTVFLWKWLYNPDSGLLNSLLGLIGIAKQPWLQSSSTAMIAIVIMTTWAGAGGAMLIYQAALQGIPSHLYDAAQIDGANIWRRIWHITLPQMRIIMSYMFVLQIIGTMQVFTEPFVLTGGGPAHATETVMMLVYDYAFVHTDFGSAAAMSLIMFVVLIAFTILYLQLMKRTTGMGQF